MLEQQANERGLVVCRGILVHVHQFFDNLELFLDFSRVSLLVLRKLDQLMFLAYYHHLTESFLR